MVTPSGNEMERTKKWNVQKNGTERTTDRLHTKCKKNVSEAVFELA